jgi:crotonobetainyl-CoA:carnitine CoA-transferase CaiB-like acyl-CoA transferase
VANLLTGLVVAEVDEHEVVQIAGRLLQDLGAHVRRVVSDPTAVPADPSPASTEREIAEWVWSSGKAVVARPPGDDGLAALVAGCDLVLAGPAPAGSRPVERAGGPVWVHVSPFGAVGPRAAWRGSDLTCLAGAGNLYATGDPDRAPLRSRASVAYVHAAAEAVLGALAALRSASSRITVSILEAAQLVNLFEANSYDATGDRGTRAGSNVGKLPDIWACADGFVAFGLRGGATRVASMEALIASAKADGIDTSALDRRDWRTFTYVDVADDEVDDLAAPVAEYFSRHPRAKLYELALERGIMLAPLNGAADVYASRQLAATGFLVEGPRGVRLPGTFVSHGVEGYRFPRRYGAPEDEPAAVPSGAPGVDASPLRAGPLPWSGLRILELGSGIAGPAIGRYFVELGAECIRIESRTRVDVMRMISGHHPADPRAPQFEGSRLFAQLNVGKKSVTVNLRDPQGQEIGRALALTCDLVTENFSPGTMARFGLDYESLRTDAPGLVMVSSCLWGNRGPERGYPGYGSQAAALSGYSLLTGWPDRTPVGIYPGAITDSLGPAFAAAAAAAALRRRDETGEGAYLDLSQAETALYSLSPWLAHFAFTGIDAGRAGNRLDGVPLHTVVPCAGDDRWVAIALWDDDDLRKFAAASGVELGTTGAGPGDADAREAAVARWTRSRDAVAVAEILQEAGLEAYPVNDFADVHRDPQLMAAGHFVDVAQPHLGTIRAQRASYRIDGVEATPCTRAPCLGEHTDEILGSVLGLHEDAIAKLVADGVLA